MINQRPRVFDSTNLFVLLYFVALFVIGAFTYGDFGMSWDEHVSRDNGLVSAKYVLTKFFPNRLAAFDSADVPPLEVYMDRDYGVAFELPLVVLEKGLMPHASTATVYKFRHACTFLIFFIGVIFFYLLAARRFESPAWGLIGCTLLLTSPRIFAEAFYNDKDIVLLSAFIIATYCMVRFLEEKTLRSAMWFGLATAFATDVRILGVLLPCATLGFIAWEMGFQLTGTGRRKAGAAFTAYLGFAAVFTYLMWPYLWEHPLVRFLESFHNMSKFRWGGTVLYLGQRISAGELPWHYLPVWIAVSTPIAYLALFVLGLALIATAALRRLPRLYATRNQRDDLVFAALVIAPLLAIIVLHSVVYDGWRQMYFVYGSFLMVALSGAHRLWSWWTNKTGSNYLRFPAMALLTLTATNAAYAVYFIARFHPNENVYFNALAGNNVAERFERDYWGLSYRQGLEYVLDTDKRSVIRVRPNQPPGVYNTWMLAPRESDRLKMVEANEDYYITEFRNFDNHPTPTYPAAAEVYNVVVGGVKILAVYKHER